MNLAIMIAFLGFVSCEGPEGPEGPVGPKGDKGDTGATGATGATGQDGQDGNANVISISLLSEDITWVEEVYLGHPVYKFSLINSSVNEDIINHGAVLGYCKLGDNWFQLPVTWIFLGESFSIIHSFSPGTITLYSFNANGGFDPFMITEGQLIEYRFLLITDNTVAGSKGITAETEIKSKLSKAGIDVSNYYEVIEYYGINSR